MENVLVSSRGYGELEGEARKTSEMRHFLDTVGRPELGEGSNASWRMSSR